MEGNVKHVKIGLRGEFMIVIDAFFMSIASFLLIFALTDAVILFFRNSFSPVETIEATLIRKPVRILPVNNDIEPGLYRVPHKRIFYFTFKTTKGTFFTMMVKEKEYQKFPEESIGFLTHQGTRYKGFEVTK